MHRFRPALVVAAAILTAACTADPREALPAGQAAEDNAAAEAPAPVAVPPIEPGEYTIDVYKSPTCGCCTAWEEHMEEHGFTVNSHVTDEVYPVKVAQGLPPRLASCHTGIVNGYVVEGHVPAPDVIRMLRERPQIAGIAVPGMPIGSPGMEQGPYRERYDVISFDRQGNQTVFARH
jgi:hypothetical protein